MVKNILEQKNIFLNYYNFYIINIKINLYLILMSDEIYKIINNFSNYEISNLGNLRNEKK